MLDDLGELNVEFDELRDLNTPPGSRQVEDAVIGSILKRPGVVGDLAVQLSPDDFTSPPHRAAYAAAISLARRQIPTDYTTLSQEMAAQGAMGAGEALPLPGRREPIGTVRGIREPLRGDRVTVRGLSPVDLGCADDCRRRMACGRRSRRSDRA